MSQPLLLTPSHKHYSALQGWQTSGLQKRRLPPAIWLLLPLSPKPQNRKGNVSANCLPGNSSLLPSLPSTVPRASLSFVTCLEKMCFHVCTFPHRLQMRPEMSLNTDILSKETEKQVVCRFRRAPPFAPVDDWLPVCHWNQYRAFLVVEPAADMMLVFAEPTIKKRVKKWAIPSDRRGGPSCLFFLLAWVYTFYKQWENPTRSPLCEVLDILHKVAFGTFHTIFCSCIQSVLSFNPFRVQVQTDFAKS